MFPNLQTPLLKFRFHRWRSFHSVVLSWIQVTNTPRCCWWSTCRWRSKLSSPAVFRDAERERPLPTGIKAILQLLVGWWFQNMHKSNWIISFSRGEHINIYMKPHETTIWDHCLVKDAPLWVSFPHIRQFQENPTIAAVNMKKGTTPLKEVIFVQLERQVFGTHTLPETNSEFTPENRGFPPGSFWRFRTWKPPFLEAIC